MSDGPIITGDTGAAVAAVLLIHAPTPLTAGAGRTVTVCDHCWTGNPFCTVSDEWPCQTVAAIGARVQLPPGWSV